jgi:hypothetical protein
VPITTIMAPKMMRAGIEAKAHFTMNQTIDQNFILMSVMMISCCSLMVFIPLMR